MKVLILTDGEIFNGGYSTIAFKLQCILNARQIESELFTFISTKKEKYQNNEIYIPTFGKRNTEIRTQIAEILDVQSYDKTICTSPWSLFYCSFWCSIKVLYFKGGGLKYDKKIRELENKSILDVNIDDFWDSTTIDLEKQSFARIRHLTIIPTTNLMYMLLLKSKEYQNKKIVNSMDFLFYEDANGKATGSKIYDIIFIVSNHKRITKNSKFAYKIFEQFPLLKKVVIGLHCDHYKKIPNTTAINEIITNDKINTYLSKTKLILIPSFYDTGPSVFIEGLLNHCMPICYHNCGYAMLDLECCIMPYLDLKLWCSKIGSLSSKYDLIRFSIIINSMNYNINKSIVEFIDHL